MPTGASESARASASCSALSALHGVVLAATAPTWQSLLAFELLLPWTPRLTGSRAGAPDLDLVLERIAETAPGVRALAVSQQADGPPPDSGIAASGDGRAPGPEVGGGGRLARVLYFESRPAGVAGQRAGGWPPAPDPDGGTAAFSGADRAVGSFGGFRGREFLVARDALPALLEALAFDLDAPGEAREVPRHADSRDLFVCTHGARDACCGRLSYPVYRALEKASRAPTRLWRSSHLGGHRFAPTLLDLPSGRLFGRVATSDVDDLLSAGGPTAKRLCSIDRGCVALPAPVQAVELETRRRFGARVHGAALDWEVAGEGRGGVVEVRLTVLASASDSLQVRAAVERRRGVAAPESCGKDAAAQDLWALRDWKVVDGA